MSDTKEYKTVRLDIRSAEKDFPAVGGYADGTASEGAALIIVNIDLLAQAYCGDEDKDAAFGFKESFIEVLAHEMLHVAEEIYGLTFSEERVEVALAKARNHLLEHPDEGADILETTQVMAKQQDEIVALSAEVSRLREGLEEIAKYGKKNSGHGYSCFKMAENFLSKDGKIPK